MQQIWLPLLSRVNLVHKLLITVSFYTDLFKIKGIKHAKYRIYKDLTKLQLITSTVDYGELLWRMCGEVTALIIIRDMTTYIGIV